MRINLRYDSIRELHAYRLVETANDIKPIFLDYLVVQFRITISPENGKGSPAPSALNPRDCCKFPLRPPPDKDWPRLGVRP
jgi:hypothetical protein